jgi:hypothetical protein
MMPGCPSVSLWALVLEMVILVHCSQMRRKEAPMPRALTFVQKCTTLLVACCCVVAHNLPHGMKYERMNECRFGTVACVIL